MSTSATAGGPESLTFEVTSAFTLELLHLSDQEASSAAVVDAPSLSAVLAALRAQDVGNDGLDDNTLTLASGDLFIPGVFFSASQTVFGSVGLADIQIQNELGIQASALGNHDFDLGTGVLAGLINGTALGSIFGADFGGAAFPYLSTTLAFSPFESRKLVFRHYPGRPEKGLLLVGTGAWADRGDAWLATQH